MQQICALGLDDTITHQLFETFDTVMNKFTLVRKEYGSHEGLRDAVAVAIFEIVSAGERNLRTIESYAESSGRQYLKRLCV